MKPENGQTTRWFFDRVQTAEALADKIGVLIVANVQGRTKPLDDYEGDSVITEFLTNTELDHFIEGFEKAGIYCEVVLDDEGCLQWLNSKRSSFPRPHLMVYNLAQSALGHARLSAIPGLCRLYHIPLVDSDAYAVAVAQHKFHCPAILRQLGLPAAKSWWFTKNGWWPQPPPDGLTVIAKPTYDSASIGIHKDSVFEIDSSAFEKLMSRVDVYHQPITVQEFVSGFE